MHIIYLLIGFLDELIYGIGEAAWPLIRNDLHLNYVQIGLALSLPGFLGNLVEPFIFTVADTWKRRAIILAGGIFFIISLALTGMSTSFLLLLSSFILFNPSSGAFVSLSQASLMDLQAGRREQNMARWTFAGSLGVFIGPLILSAAAYLGFGWRGMFIALALLSTMILTIAWRRIPDHSLDDKEAPDFRDVLHQFRLTFTALKDWTIVRWLILLEFSDLMLDVLYAFLPLYFVDVAKFTPTQAALSVAIWTGVGLLGDFLLIPLVERMQGLDYLRISVVIELVLFPVFLLTRLPGLKLVLIGIIGFFNSGWYAILKANLFNAMDGRSGAVLTLDNVSGLFGKLIPFGIGLVAHNFGIGIAMWILLAGPIALLLGLPKGKLTLPDDS